MTILRVFLAVVIGYVAFAAASMLLVGLVMVRAGVKMMIGTLILTVPIIYLIGLRRSAASSP